MDRKQEEQKIVRMGYDLPKRHLMNPRSYEFMSEENSNIYDRAIEGTIPQEEANRIIVKILLQYRDSKQGHYRSETY